MGKNILFLLVDGLRADRVLAKGKPCQTPFIDYLIRNGTAFTQAVSVASFTSPCVASILTGVYPFVHGIEWFSGNKLNPKCVTLAEALRKAGYTTCAMVTGPLLPELGIDRGFDKFLHRNEDDNVYGEFRNRLKNYLETAQRPWFLFVHLWELHYPVYLPKTSKYLPNLNKYDKALESLDSELSKLLDCIYTSDTVIILHSDHGERLPTPFESIQRYLLGLLMETPLKEKEIFWFRFYKNLFQYFPNFRSKQGHGYHLYEPLIRVPLIIAGNGVPKNKKVAAQVTQKDIFPTVLDVAGIKDADIETLGPSLLQNLGHSDTQDKPIYIGPGGIRDIWPPAKDEWLEGLRTEKWKYISRYNKDEPISLYDLDNDPQEFYNLVETRKDITQKFKEELKEIKSMRERKILEMSADDQEKIKKRLKTLGYI